MHVKPIYLNVRVCKESFRIIKANAEYDLKNSKRIKAHVVEKNAES